MNKVTKKWIVAAVCLVIIGSVIFAAAMTAYKWDFTKLGTVRYETETHSISEEFADIAIDTDTADIIFALSDDGMCKVICYEQENEKHSVEVRDGTLLIDVVCEKEWYEYIGVNFGAPKITVYLPESEYSSLCIKESTGDIKIPAEFEFDSIDITASTGDVENYACASGSITIETDTGDIRIKDISAAGVKLSVSTGEVVADSVTCEGNIEINVSTGDVQLTDTVCKVFFSSGSTGDLNLENVIAAGNFSIKRSTGCVKLDGCDADEIFIETDTGDVTGSLLSDKIFITETSTGDVDVPKLASGGRCEITTSTGDIKIDVL